ncbi:hypothetical protein SAMN04489727_5775 [Amycolatopsis tolypomycina]|uniref:Uncharacterized protein n=1 Tax=Amycolatopsis tolypomycina TaxID=208445 RepID=A0A1H4WUI8_9PSEU|nr:hypothetical protein SAMN04489727_5775 [Amycolatopsis tolypomycina]
MWRARPSNRSSASSSRAVMPRRGTGGRACAGGRIGPPRRRGGPVPPTAAGRADRSVAGGKHQAVALGNECRRAAGLGPGSLLHQEELAAGVVGARLVEVDHHLQREHSIAVEVAVQRVPAARLVAQQDRCWPPLACRVADRQPFVQSGWPFGRAAEACGPVLGDRQQPRVERLPQALHRIRERCREVVVVAVVPEAVTAQVHRRPEVRRLIPQCDQLRALGWGEQPRQERAAVVVDLGGHRDPVGCGDALFERCHAASVVSLVRLAVALPG